MHQKRYLPAAGADKKSGKSSILVKLLNIPPRDRSVKSFRLVRVEFGEIACLFEDLKTVVILGVNKKTGYPVKVEIQESTLKNTIFFWDQSL